MPSAIKRIVGFLLAIKVAPGQASVYDRPEDGSDLETFVTRPELRPPKLKVDIHEPGLVSPGYFFVSPYSEVKERQSSGLYLPHQTGPHIYDQRGNLVWSGANFSKNGRAIFDFKMTVIHGVPSLSMLLVSHRQAMPYPGGAGLILDTSLNVTHAVQTMVGSGIENMHEFNVIEDGRRALMITHQIHYRQYMDGFTDFGPLRSIGNPGFVELDIATGKPVFEWWALDKISPSESNSVLPPGLEESWDWLHLNSVDKAEDGNYIVSSRYANTIYKISALDGSIIWRLGGKNSSFSMQGFNFSGQHDARIVQIDGSGSKECVSFLNNAATDISPATSTCSSGMVVCLDLETMTAQLVQEYRRPDGLISELRGNMQSLPSSVLISWSDNGYMSEFTQDGRHILDARFASHRLTTYRGYKFNISLQPEDNPVLKAFVYGQTTETSTTVFYVSWNGATEVVSWRFFASHNDEESTIFLGEVDWAGFETRFMAFGCFTKGFARAIGKDGKVLGQSLTETIALPSDWSYEEGKVIHASGIPKHQGSKILSTSTQRRLTKWELALRPDSFLTSGVPESAAREKRKD